MCGVRQWENPRKRPRFLPFFEMGTLCEEEQPPGKGNDVFSVADVGLEKSRDIQVRESQRRMPGQGWRAGAQSGAETDGKSATCQWSWHWLRAWHLVQALYICPPSILMYSCKYAHVGEAWGMCVEVD